MSFVTEFYVFLHPQPQVLREIFIVILLNFFPKNPELLDLVTDEEQRRVDQRLDQPFQTTGQKHQTFDRHRGNAHLHQPQQQIPRSGGCHPLPGFNDPAVKIVIKQSGTDPGNCSGDLDVIRKRKGAFRCIASQQAHHQYKDQIIQDGGPER